MGTHSPRNSAIFAHKAPFLVSLKRRIDHPAEIVLAAYPKLAYRPVGMLRTFGLSQQKPSERHCLIICPVRFDAA